MRNFAGNAGDSEVLVQAEHVSKKFCRSLKRSLYYGVRDVATALNPWGNDADGRAAGAVMPLRRDEFWALKDISFELRRGQCLGLIGHNGAGKSTLLKILNGLLPPDSGRIRMRGRVAALIELNAGFNPILTGRENVFNQASLLGFSAAETRAKFDEIVDFAEVGEFIDMPVQNYSSGMRVRLGFAVAAQMEADILLIDEVLAVGDAAFRSKCLNKMSELMNTSAFIFVSHTMPQVAWVCDHVALLDHGRLVTFGPDVSAGINQYLSLQEVRTATVLGSGKASVTSVRASNGAASAEMGGVLALRHGDPLEIDCSLQLDADLDGVAIQYLLWNMEMMPVFSIVGPELHGFVLDNLNGGGRRVRAHVDRVNLNSGRYYLSAVISSPDLRTTYCRHDNLLAIDVKNDSPSGAYVIDEGIWSHPG